MVVFTQTTPFRLNKVRAGGELLFRAVHKSCKTRAAWTPGNNILNYDQLSQPVRICLHKVLFTSVNFSGVVRPEVNIN